MVRNGTLFLQRFSQYTLELAMLPVALHVTDMDKFSPEAQMPGMPAMPGVPVVPGPLQGPAENPESVPVGVMSSMLKQVSRRGKDLHAAFVPYRPLDPLYTPQTLPPLPPPNARLLERLAQFYRVVGDAAKPERQERSRSPPPELN
eukprot:Skav231569  [mRNA]  locus=scaffold481:193160:204956:- [translate_table: standard]